MNIEAIPPLENGDRVSSVEFEKRVQHLPPQLKTELIDGIVHMAAAALRYRSHGLPHSHIMGWLAFYMANTPGVELADNATIRLDLDNQPQPDALLRIKNGQSSVSKDDYIEGAPELIVEIAGSSASYDLYDKMQVYCRHGVKEYIVWQVYDQQISWFYLQDGKYFSYEPNPSGLIESQVFPGLVLDIHSLISYDLAKVLSVLEQNLNTEIHQNFIKCISEE